MDSHCDDAAAIGACAQALIRGFPNRGVNGTRLPLPKGEVALWMPQQYAALVSHDHRGADGDAAVEIGHVVIGHAEASR
jgi:hypothetical protein